MKEFRDYDITLPELVYDVLDYFRANNKVKAISEKSVVDYCSNSRFNNQGRIKGLIQPDALYLICENLVKKRLLSCINPGAFSEGLYANYIFRPSNDSNFLKKAPATIFRLNCMAYGFRYIYNTYKEYVYPVIVKKDGIVGMATCFRFQSGILTAKHCLIGDEVEIGGYTADILRQRPVLIGKDDNLDMAYIELDEQTPISTNEVQVLDEVIVMGYPRIPMFKDFCSVERASISSIPTRGAIASFADQYIAKNIGQLMLVTARIRGGNSGGPVIDSTGAVVGVAFAEPESEGTYDDMGYGIAYPIEVFFQMMQDPQNMKVNFVDTVQ